MAPVWPVRWAGTDRTVLPLLVAVLLLGAAPAPTATRPPNGETYESEDLIAKPPGSRWVLHTSIPGAPNLRGAYVNPRTSGGKGSVDPSSMITFGIDPVPFTKDPEAYVKSGFDRMGQPPLSFRPGKRAAVKLKGSAPAFRIEYTDRDGVRHFTQVAILTPRGGILIVTLQAPSAGTFTEDLPVFLEFIDNLQLRPAASRPAPKPKPR